MEQSQTHQGGKTWAVVAAALIVAAGVLYWNLGPLLAPQPDVAVVEAGLDAPNDVPSAPDAPAKVADAPATPDPVVLPDVEPSQSVAVEVDTAPRPDLAIVPDAEPETVPVPAGPVLTPPRFDLVRVEDDGAALVAGQAGSAGTVYLVIDGLRVNETATPAGQGEAFVIFTSIEPAAQPRALKLETVLADDTAVQSLDQVYISAQLPVEPLVASAPAVAATPAVDTTTAVEPSKTEPALERPTIILTDEQGSARVLAPPVATVALDTIQYDLAGEVEVGGRAAGDGFVRVYLDNRPITTSRVQDGGFWNTALPDIETGTYTLRVDELDADGTVTSRVETPFLRESPELLSSFLEPGSAFNVKAMTMQPGATLWAVAEAKYGDGTQFMKVFEANRATISDPDLIFPGQVFDLPD